MSVTYEVYARNNKHDEILKRLKKEVRKDKHWTPKQKLLPGQYQSLEAIKSAIKELGYHLVRTQTDYENHLVVFMAD